MDMHLEFNCADHINVYLENIGYDLLYMYKPCKS